MPRPRRQNFAKFIWSRIFIRQVSPHSIEPPEVIETKYYRARIDAKTGALSSLKLKNSGRELRAAPANVIVAERPTTKQKDDPGDKMPPRPDRTRLEPSSDHASVIHVKQGPLAYNGRSYRKLLRRRRPSSHDSLLPAQPDFSSVSNSALLDRTMRTGSWLRTDTIFIENTRRSRR